MGCALFGAFFVRELYLQVPPPNFATYEHGALKRARREEAMLGARIAAWRLAETGLPHAVGATDMTNAFACGEKVNNRLGETDRVAVEILNFCRWRALVQLTTCDGEIVALTGGAGKWETQMLAMSFLIVSAMFAKLGSGTLLRKQDP